MLQCCYLLPWGTQFDQFHYLYLTEALHQKDMEIRHCCEAKNKLMDDLMNLYSDEHHNVSLTFAFDNKRPSTFL